MNQQCKVCGEPAAGFHFGAFTCEGCKSFFGRSYNNLSSISECKNNGECVINKKNRTSCKACRLRKCLLVGMSKSGSRYGRRSNWFKIHCLLQEQQQQLKGGPDSSPETGFQFQLGPKEEFKSSEEYNKSPSVSSQESHHSDDPWGSRGPYPAPLFRPPFGYDDNFNKSFLVESVLAPPRAPEDAPIDLSLKSPPSGASSDISVDDYPSPPSPPTRTTPLDLTTKVV
ncbi:hypothetical protein AAG570_013900 [Ranatra chinensis]|uniref:Nuclear receptor domain-containing protein n=1 Tax=Ranatra chinensis TaxID=642074 RepID=A0ABD0YW12_9HEMI